jgi:sterol desaturase/sphingolipid hydroxylase (fatty acid hydroxylase superfamily)
VAENAPASFWKNRKHNLDRMTFGELVYAFFTYYAIWVYIALGLAALVLTVLWWENPLRQLAVVPATSVAFALGWYLSHRYVLHSRFLYKTPFTSATWKRIHFDHHQDPNDLRILFGALHTTLPTIGGVLMPIGYAINGPAGAALAMGFGMALTCFYEFCHCVQHLNYTPKSPFLKEIKRLHLAHHFHNEQGNYGITNYFWDRLFGTYYAQASDLPKSPTVFNLGYTAQEAERYPWVARLSGGTRGDGHPRRFWGQEGQAAPESTPRAP